MKKQDLQKQIDDIKTSIEGPVDALAVARARHESAERLLRDADVLLQKVAARYSEIERRIHMGERIEADAIDSRTMSDMLRFVATKVGVEETTPGRFVGGYEAIAKGIDDLVDAEEKAVLLTAFFNVASRYIVGKGIEVPGLFRDATSARVREIFVAFTKDETVPSDVRDRLNVAVSESQRTAKKVEQAVREAVQAASQATMPLWSRR